MSCGFDLKPISLFNSIYSVFDYVDSVNVHVIVKRNIRQFFFKTIFVKYFCNRCHCANILAVNIIFFFTWYSVNTVNE